MRGLEAVEQPTELKTVRLGGSLRNERFRKHRGCQKEKTPGQNLHNTLHSNHLEQKPPNVQTLPMLPKRNALDAPPIKMFPNSNTNLVETWEASDYRRML